jgi:hypothetical protein
MIKERLFTIGQLKTGLTMTKFILENKIWFDKIRVDYE